MAESTGGIRRGGPRRPRPRSSSAPCPAYRSENAQTSAGKGGTSDQLTRPVGNTISTDGAENAPTVAAAPVIVKDRLVRAPTVSQAAAQLTVRTAENSQAILPVLAPSLGANRTMGIPEQSNGITDSSPRRRSPVFFTAKRCRRAIFRIPRRGGPRFNPRDGYFWRNWVGRFRLFTEESTSRGRRNGYLANRLREWDVSPYKRPVSLGLSLVPRYISGGGEGTPILRHGIKDMCRFGSSGCGSL